MAFECEGITKKEFFKNIDNILLGFKLTHYELAGKNQIEITAYVYESQYAPLSPEKEKSVATGTKRIDYADVLNNYDSRKDRFGPELIHGIFLALNAELAPNGYQLKTETKEVISEALKIYIPRVISHGEEGTT